MCVTMCVMEVTEEELSRCYPLDLSWGCVGGRVLLNRPDFTGQFKDFYS